MKQERGEPVEDEVKPHFAEPKESVTRGRTRFPKLRNALRQLLQTPC